MTWPTTHGERTLEDAEAALFRGAIGMMVDTHVAEWNDQAEPWSYGVVWFDQWDAGQRLWILRHVSAALLSDHRLPGQAAIFDAAADAILFEISDQVEMEIDEGEPDSEALTWREGILNAISCQRHQPLHLSSEDDDLQRWRTEISRIGDEILGVRLYQRAEAFRDADYERTLAFLRDRGLPDDYLSRLPPLQSPEQIQRSVDRIQSLVFI